MTEPQPELEPEQAPEPVDPYVADAIKRSWNDELWYRSLPFRGRP